MTETPKPGTRWPMHAKNVPDIAIRIETSDGPCWEMPGGFEAYWRIEGGNLSGGPKTLMNAAWDAGHAAGRLEERAEQEKRIEAIYDAWSEDVGIKTDRLQALVGKRRA